MRGILKNIYESVLSVAPVIIIIFLLQFFFAPMQQELMARFILGTILLTLGLAIFNHGVQIGMEPMGEETGSAMANSRRIWVVLIAGFFIGMVITLAEPDVKVLTNQVGTVSGGSISSMTLLLSVGAGVGVMVVLAFMRILMQWPLRYVLWIAYVIIFILAAFAPPEYVPIAFDSGGVTTGPMTVPFIMSMGVGVAAIRSDKTAEDDSFGLVGLVSAGPIIAVLILGVLST